MPSPFMSQSDRSKPESRFLAAFSTNLSTPIPLFPMSLSSCESAPQYDSANSETQTSSVTVTCSVEDPPESCWTYSSAEPLPCSRDDVIDSECGELGNETLRTSHLSSICKPTRSEDSSDSSKS